MKRLSVTLLSVLMTVMVMMAQGWPANYGGVMLQGFYWDSYQDSKWTNLTNQVDELSSYFNLIWVPNSGQIKKDEYNTPNDWGYYSMGYMPVYWLKHNTCFGTEDELKAMINAFKAKGTGIIEDVVINHKNGLTNWADFPDEKVTIGDKTYTLTWAQDMEALWGICKNDELFWNNGDHGDDHYWYTTSTNDCLVSDDEGDNFDGCRDLDHTNAQVQKNIATYLDFLVNELGYAGFRYDMVKGYAGYYVGKYNSELPFPADQDFFSVGEYWDSSYDNVVYNWINKTALPESANSQIQSAAFDFPLKYSINDAFNNGHWSVLQGNKGIAGDPNMSRYSMTFVDNHDTYRNDYDRVNNNVLAANAFILGLPGTPCIFLPHWQQYRVPLMKMITARKAAGITNQSKVIDNWSNQNGFYMKVQGKQTEGQNTETTDDDRYASIIVISGYLAETEYNHNGYDLVTSGENFAYYISHEEYNKNTYDDIEESCAYDYTIYVRNNHNDAPYLYIWNGETKYNGEWDDCRLTDNDLVTLSDGQTWYKKTIHASSYNIILHDSQGRKTQDIKDLKDDIYIRYYEKDDEPNYKLQFETTQNFFGETQSEYIYAFTENASDWNEVRAWAWDTGFYPAHNYTGDWPGHQMTNVGMSDSGKGIYLWRISKTEFTGAPNGILFNNGKEDEQKQQTADFSFVNGGYYGANGLTSSDLISLKAAEVLEGVTKPSTKNWNGQTENVAQVQSSGNASSNAKLGIYFPAGTYTVQAIVRGTADNSLSLNVGTSSSSVTLTGMETNSPSTVTTTGTIEPYVTGTNGGWQKVQSTYTLAEEGLLHITLSSDASTWQVGTLNIIKEANANGKYQTVATTQTTQTNVDVTGVNNFSFFERGANPNALIKANSDILPYNVIVNGTCANLRLTDGAYDFHANEGFTATNITYDRQFRQGKKVTVCLPFAVSSSEVSAMGLTVYAFDQVLEDGSLYFKVVDEMAANTPYLVVAGDNTMPFANLDNNNSRPVPATGTLEVSKGEGNNAMTFKGTMKRLTLNSGTNATYYGYSNGEFVKVGSNVSINPFRAYVMTSGTSQVASINALFEDPSAIRDINAVSINGTAIYTLDGRKVTSSHQTLPKGVYIKGGKKYIIK